MTELVAPTPESAIGTRIAAVVDDLSASAALEFKSARETIDRAEQLLLQSSAKTKAVLENHIYLVNQTKAEIEGLRAAVQELAANHAKIVNAETV